MKLHEYQAKRQMEAFGLPVLKGAVVSAVSDVPSALRAVCEGPIRGGGRLLPGRLR